MSEEKTTTTNTTPTTSTTPTKSSKPLKNTPNPALQSKITKVLETRTTARELQHALSYLSTFYEGENDVNQRQRLRGQIEQRNVEINKNLLQLFAKVKDELTQVEETVGAMHETCDSLETRLRRTKELSGKLIQQTDALAKQRERAQVQHSMATQFLARFQLTEEEKTALKASDLRPSFFDALQRVRSIHDDCKLLLRTQHQRAGLEIMDAMAAHQEAAYRRLYRWVKSACAKALESDGELSSLLPRALIALRQRSVLHGYALEDIGRARGAALGHSFALALTTGGPGGTPRPIEMHAHDPLRYVGDMLAWIHQAVASEYEFACMLLRGGNQQNKNNNKNNNNNNNNNNKNNNVDNKQINIDNDQTENDAANADLVRVLNAACESVATPLSMRVEQLLQGELTTNVVYRLAHLLDFYAVTLSKRVTDKASLVDTVRQLQAAAERRFESSLRAAGERLARQPPAATSRLTPSYEAKRAIAQLTELMTTFESSLVPPEQRAAAFEPVLDAVVAPLLRACRAGAASLPSAARSAYAANCVDAIAAACEPFAFASNYHKLLRATAADHTNRLLVAALRAVLGECGVPAPPTPSLDSTLDTNATAPTLRDVAVSYGATLAADVDVSRLTQATAQLIQRWPTIAGGISSSTTHQSVDLLASSGDSFAVALLSNSQRRRVAVSALRALLLEFYASLRSNVSAENRSALRYSADDMQTLLGGDDVVEHPLDSQLLRAASTKLDTTIANEKNDN